VSGCCWGGIGTPGHGGVHGVVLFIVTRPPSCWGGGGVSTRLMSHACMAHSPGTDPPEKEVKPSLDWPPCHRLESEGKTGGASVCYGLSSAAFLRGRHTPRRRRRTLVAPDLQRACLKVAMISGDKQARTAPARIASRTRIDPCWPRGCRPASRRPRFSVCRPPGGSSRWSAGGGSHPWCQGEGGGGGRVDDRRRGARRALVQAVPGASASWDPGTGRGAAGPST